MAAVEVETGRRLLVRRRAVLVGLGLIRVPVLVVAQVLGVLTGFVPAIAAPAAQLNWSGRRASMRIANQRRMKRV